MTRRENFQHATQHNDKATDHPEGGHDKRRNR